MIYDIAAAQYLYGANEDHKNGDDTHAASGEKKLWTIWDAGGVHDKLDIASAAGASKGAVIDLRGGVDANDDVRFSLIGKERIAIALDPKHDWEKPIEIEHAKGHDGDDVMLGNGGNNSLEGGAGIDTLIGGAGKDTLKGGSDADLLSDSWWHTFDTSLKTDNSNDTLYGNGGDDELVSYDGTDLLDGGAGNDKFYGFSSGTMVGGSDHNTYSIISEDGTYTITGGAGTDAINLYDGAVTIHGGGGSTHISMNPNEYVEIHGGGTGTIKIGTVILGGRYFHLDPDEPRDRIWGNPFPSSTEPRQDKVHIVGGSWRALKTGAQLDIWREGSNGTTVRIVGWQEGDYGISLANQYSSTNRGSFKADQIVETPYGLPVNDPQFQKFYFGVHTSSVDGAGFTEESVRQRLGLKKISGTPHADIMDYSKEHGEQTILALKGNDSIVGSSGDNMLDGGEDRDTLTGGLGDDTFLFTSATHSTRLASDRITDFTSGDKIDVTALGYAS
ncbi:MAG: hypothetical protein EAY76_00110, partial [Alphaproteobacteria bacterium]